ncbi:MAG: MBL fold metallo-hydrolase [Methanospirillum sp.]|uniref:MBL fold metallo-hydrolase n=1 Tax=Methanospirillum sp. TaxID=45200 RepID=UPI0023714BCA|nr:MBL fold metallo-hydrolase [Methanospirillum sp.]MDD1729812.1 MBL fold metallo-hydrolase [Methanospirillum sp.]
MDTDPEEARFNEGLSLIKSGNIEEAIEIFSELIEKDERNHRVWNAYGVALSQTDRKESAIHCFGNALALDPGNPAYLRNLNRISNPSEKKPRQKPAELTKNTKYSRNKPLLILIGTCVIILILSVIFMFSSGYWTSPSYGLTQTSVSPVETSYPSPNISNNSTITENSTPVVTLTPVPQPTETRHENQTPQVIFHFIDVGQGDAALIQSGGKNMLVDAGSAESGRRLVSYLKNLGIKSLDIVLISHPFDDHIGGMTDILNAFPVVTYIDNGETYSSDIYQKVINLVTSGQTSRTIATAGMSIPFDNETSIAVIGPHTLSGHQDEDSLVMKATVGNVSVLFPGDASDVKGHATIMKIPNHGSDTAISSIMNVHPDAAILSLGSGNRYDYPRSVTMSALNASGSRLFRTDMNGTVVITTDGNTWNATTTR